MDNFKFRLPSKIVACLDLVRCGLEVIANICFIIVIQTYAPEFPGKKLLFILFGLGFVILGFRILLSCLLLKSTSKTANIGKATEVTKSWKRVYLFLMFICPVALLIIFVFGTLPLGVWQYVVVFIALSTPMVYVVHWHSIELVLACSDDEDIV